MSLKVQIEKIADHYKAVSKAIGALADSAVLVGVPEQKTGRNHDGGEINNATLAYIHENGSKRANIPARAFLKPGIERAKQPITGHLKGAAEEAAMGNESGMLGELNQAGQVSVDSVRGVFTDNNWTPLKASTLRAKGAIKTESGWVGKTNPLIDSGQLRKSIAYVVEEKA